MHSLLWSGLVATAVVFSEGTALAADFGDDLYEGSIKDTPQYAPASSAPAPGRCYVRGDVGYSASSDPTAKWTVTDGVGNFVTDRVRTLDMEDTWFVEGGAGCGTGPRGFRGEIVFGYHGANVNSTANQGPGIRQDRHR